MAIAVRWWLPWVEKEHRTCSGELATFCSLPWKVVTWGHAHCAVIHQTRHFVLRFLLYMGHGSHERIPCVPQILTFVGTPPGSYRSVLCTKHSRPSRLNPSYSHFKRAGLWLRPVSPPGGSIHTGAQTQPLWLGTEATRPEDTVSFSFQNVMKMEA